MWPVSWLCLAPACSSTTWSPSRALPFSWRCAGGRGELLGAAAQTLRCCAKVGGFHAVLHITIHATHPEKQPTLMLQSVYHADASKGAAVPFSMTFTNYRYSPRWSAAELAARIHTFLVTGFDGEQVINCVGRRVRPWFGLGPSRLARAERPDGLS